MHQHRKGCLNQGAPRVALVVKNSPANAGGGGKRRRFDPWVRKMPWMRKWHLTPVFLPGKSHAQRILVGSWGQKESNTTKHLSTGTDFIKKKKRRLLLDTVTLGRILKNSLQSSLQLSKVTIPTLSQIKKLIFRAHRLATSHG